MKKLIIFILIAISFSCVLNSKPIKAKKLVDPEFVKFWIQLKNNIFELYNCRLNLYNTTKDEFKESLDFSPDVNEIFPNTIVKTDLNLSVMFSIDNFDFDSEIFNGILYRQILNTNTDDFIITKNGEYTFDPWLNKKDDPDIWSKGNILTAIPKGKEIYIKEYIYGGDDFEYRASNTLVFSKIKGKYQLIDIYFMTFD
jgi:hypothetical protein